MLSRNQLGWHLDLNEIFFKYKNAQKFTSNV